MKEPSSVSKDTLLDTADMLIELVKELESLEESYAIVRESRDDGVERIRGLYERIAELESAAKQQQQQKKEEKSEYGKSTA